jgi:S-adenosylmethionine:tRNA ribosyltransferase-isomerase
LAQVSDFHYDLPPELIAQEPPAQRDGARLLVIDRRTSEFHDDQFCNFPQYVNPGDCLVLNDTRVVPARLHGRRNRSDGAEVEIFLLRATDESETVWQVLAKPGKRVRTGDQMIFGPDFSARVLAQGEFGERTLQFESSIPVRDAVEQYGSVPLPPYIHRQPAEADRERYQTVFAEKRGSVAAPTAGLHFTPAILDRCRERGAAIAHVTLHVGLGTFAPLREQDLSRIELHEEYFEVQHAEAERIAAAKRVLCVGTTSVRTIESAAQRGSLEASGTTRLFISPGFSFQVTGAMLTNFHLPSSSLLMLVSAFAGQDLVLRAYRHAVAERYRFFSYGDAMLIV